MLGWEVGKVGSLADISTMGPPAVVDDLALDDALVVHLVPVERPPVAVSPVPLALPLELLRPALAVAADIFRQVGKFQDVLLYVTVSVAAAL